MVKEVDCLVVGGGLSGMVAAYYLRRLGLERVLLVERRSYWGGILFDWMERTFEGGRSGCELVGEWEERLGSVMRWLGTYISEVDFSSRRAYFIGGSWGMGEIGYRVIVLATGCVEGFSFSDFVGRGFKSGLFTGAQALHFLNSHGLYLGRRVVILGMGDVGLLVARSCFLRGMEVVGLVEPFGELRGSLGVMESCSCGDFPLYFGYRLVRVYGRGRVSGVCLLGESGEDRLELGCDVLVLAQRVRPRVELLRGSEVFCWGELGVPLVDNFMETSRGGVFALGGVVCPGITPEGIISQGLRLSEGVRGYLDGRPRGEYMWRVGCGGGVDYVFPMRVRGGVEGELEFYVYPRRTLRNVFLEVSSEAEGGEVYYRLFFERFGVGEFNRVLVPAEVLPEGGEFYFRVLL